MQNIILHHYPTSPFAEKIRLILGFKACTWKSVLIPNIMPKPDVVALTGGYRKTPILQVGADIYCDSALIAEVIESMVASPTLYPPAIDAASRTLAQWADSTLFWTAIPFALQPAGLAHMFAGLTQEQIKAFGDDRNSFRANIPRMRPAEAVSCTTTYLKRLEQMLAGQPFFFGQAPSIADFSIYHCLWFVVRGGPVAKVLEAFPGLTAFRERMRAFGHGHSEDLTSGEALKIASSAPPAASIGLSADTHGFAIGEKVIVNATDTGVEPVEGTLYGLSCDRISLAREDARAGKVVVHFPRLGFEMRRQK
jgi:glutathione S-transferase